MKKLLTFLLCFVLLLGAVGLVACDNTAAELKTLQTNDGVATATTSVQGVSAPKLGATIKRFSADEEDDGTPRVTKYLTATVEPATALNKQVDYSVSWASGAERASEDVTEYVSVEQDSDGSADATVSCYKGFGDDTILITVVTREGGFRAYCEVIFSGLISELEIVSQNGLTLTTNNYGYHGNTYYELGVNCTYDFNVNVNNIFDETSYDLSLVVACSDTDFKLQKDNDNSWNVITKPLSELLLDLFDITLNDTSLRIVIKNRMLLNYSAPVYSEYESDYNGGFIVTNYYLANSYKQNIDLNYNRAACDYNIQSANDTYFTVTVTDAKTGLSDEFKFWIVTSAAGLNLSANTLEF